MQVHYGFDDIKDMDIMAFLPLILPFIAVTFLLVSIAWIDLYRHRKTRDNFLIWTVVILFVSMIGPILYLVIGRKDRVKS
ncbi:PLD nuclease N-terminal domain-containing protein [Peribacillus muralis]|uniref:PLD nuclease N-terminal domain-containing protein n=1 Tax=Peribacillus muralis TaxID=264697 RepID=UPI00070A7D30|nr:PLD nuclease N-terminal domain-containing protein [Peribacillus muralis]